MKNTFYGDDNENHQISSKEKWKQVRKIVVTILSMALALALLLVGCRLKLIGNRLMEHAVDLKEGKVDSGAYHDLAESSKDFNVLEDIFR